METHEDADLPPFLKLSAGSPGTREVTLVRDELPVLQVPVEVVPIEAITTLAIEGTEDGARRDDPVYLHAAARDAEGRRVFGAKADWHVELGTASTGDLYTYSFDPDDPNELTTTLGALTATRTIAGSGQAADSNATGCSTLGGASFPFWALLGVAGLLRRR